jgi:hypothetical protein
LADSSLRAVRSNGSQCLILGSILILFLSTAIATLVGFIFGTGGALALTINAAAAMHNGKLPESSGRSALLFVYGIVYCTLGTMTLVGMQSQGDSTVPYTQIVWLSLWSVASAIAVRMATDSILAALGPIVAIALSYPIMLFFEPWHIGAIIACPVWSLTVGVFLFIWSSHHRAWATWHTPPLIPECPACKYDLTGLTTTVCPECGSDLPRQSA